MSFGWGDSKDELYQVTTNNNKLDDTNNIKNQINWVEVLTNNMQLFFAELISKEIIASYKCFQMETS